MAVKGKGIGHGKEYYETSLDLGELSQDVWEKLPENLDGTSLKKCECCGELLLEETFFSPVLTESDGTVITTSPICKICDNKINGEAGELELDFSSLSMFTKSEFEAFKLEYDSLESINDVDASMYIAMTDRFSNFLRYAWYHLGLPEPTEAQLEFCNFLQDSDEHTIVNAFRGIGKSWITSVFVAWKLWIDPDLKILVISASKERADSFSIFTKRLLQELPVLHDLIPNGERKSNKSFDVGDIAPAHAPSVKSAGITGQITGSRADLIIADDVEVIDNSATEDAREKLIEKCKDFISILTPNEASRVIYLGTPQTEESIYDKLADMGYEKYIIPARYPANIEKYKGYLAPFIIKKLIAEPDLVGHATDPKRFDDKELLSRELLIGSSTFALQFQLDTELSDSERYPLKLSDFIVADLDAFKTYSHISYASGKHQQIKDIINVGFSGDRLYEAGFTETPMIDYQGKTMYIDPSGRGTDETTYAIIGMAMGRLHLIDWGGFTGTGYSDETMTELAHAIRDNGVNVCVIEDNFGDGMFTKLFSPVVRRIVKKCSILEEKAHSNKERRIIDTLEPVLNQHRLVVSREAIKKEVEWIQRDRKNNLQYSLLYQLTRITLQKNSLKHDDRLDALAGCVKYWLEHLNKDVDLAVQVAKDKALKDELERLRKIHYKIEPPKKTANNARTKLLKRKESRNKRSSKLGNYLKRGK
jgi:hypothetical protein